MAIYFSTENIDFDLKHKMKVKKWITEVIRKADGRVGENAKNFGVPFEQELYRVIIHGVLHLLGQGDKTDPEAAQMRRREDEALHLWDTL